MQPSVCLYVAGTPSGTARERHGIFEDWFGRLLAVHEARVQVVHAADCALPDRWDELDAIVITGSPASITAPEPWIEQGIELVRHAYQTRTPVLGVCFGHQLIGAAFGGSVVRNPAGWQVATQPVRLTPAGQADPLFHGLPERIECNFSHQDIVDPDTVSPMNGIRVLASTHKAEVAAVAAGPLIRGVQFHPEFTGTISRTYVEIRREAMAAQSAELDAPEDHPDALLAAVRDAPQAEQVFHNFLRHFATRR